MDGNNGAVMRPASRGVTYTRESAQAVAKTTNWLEYKDALRELGADDLVVGSGAQASWRVLQADLMPRHFVVTTNGGKSMLRPFSSESVVAINGQQVMDSAELHDGDLVAAGAVQFVFWENTPKNRPDTPAVIATGHLIDTRSHLAYSLTLSTGIGRDPSNAIVLQSPTISRFHAEIRREAGGFALHGMGSAGTRLNGEAFGAPRLLDEGDQIQIADETYKFTRQSLPAGTRLSSSLEEAEFDLEVTRQPTVRMDSVPGRAAMAAQRGGTSVAMMATVAGVLVVLAGLALFAMLRA